MLLNAEEMQAIADELFVGNKLASGELRTTDGVRVDLRNIKSPIIVFCSWGDDITPPQQALGWIIDLYDHEDEIVAAGQTIVYCLHQSIGHLGIFVSGKVATKEHGEFAQAMDMIDLMPPGLYEAVITGVDETVENPELVQGDYLFTLEARTRRATSVHSSATAPDDDLRFADRRTSFGDQSRRFTAPSQAPWCAWRAPSKAPNWRVALHPNRLRFEMFADAEPVDAAGCRLGRTGARQPPSGRVPITRSSRSSIWRRT